MRTFVRDKAKPFVASNSSLSTMVDCETKFVHQYVKHSTKDTEDVPHAFRFGRAFHSLLEICDGDSSKLTQEVYEGIAMREMLDWTVDIAKLVVMMRTYDEARNKQEKVLARELEVFNNNYVMYVDAVVEFEGKWKLIDYKTASAFEPAIKLQLAYDSQVALYSLHAGYIAELLGLNIDDFAGFSYREVKKPGERLKKKELRDEYMARLTSECRFTDVSLADLQLEYCTQDLEKKLERARSFFFRPDLAIANRRACIKFGTPCEYYSHCYGVKYEEASGETTRLSE